MNFSRRAACGLCQKPSDLDEERRRKSMYLSLSVPNRPSVTAQMSHWDVGRGRVPSHPIPSQSEPYFGDAGPAICKDAAAYILLSLGLHGNRLLLLEIFGFSSTLVIHRDVRADTSKYWNRYDTLGISFISLHARGFIRSGSAGRLCAISTYTLSGFIIFEICTALLGSFGRFRQVRHC